MPTFEVAVRSFPDELRVTRRAIAHALRAQRIDEAHIEAVVLVTHEILAVLCERQISPPVTVTVEPLTLMTSVRVHTAEDIGAMFETFGTTERLLTALTIAFGYRPTAGGGTHLWAEVPRRHDEPAFSAISP